MAEFAGLYDMDKRTIRRLDRVRLSMEMYTMTKWLEHPVGYGGSIHYRSGGTDPIRMSAGATYHG